MLDDVRVLEISAPNTMLAGQILGDLGADVVVLEPPAGSAGRRLPPFIEGRPGLERGVAWHALNRNKRGITLDTASIDGRAVLQQLLDSTDIVLEAVAETSVLDGLTIRPEIIRCEISGFSRTGPKSGYAWTDPVLMAAGGAPAISGDHDRAPLFFPVPQAMMEAGAEAGVAALAGLLARDRLGSGQVVELQARIAAMAGALGRLVTARSGSPVARREAPPPSPLPTIPGVFACGDGFAIVTVNFSPAFVGLTQRIAAWLADEGLLAREVADLDFLALARSVTLENASATPIEAFRDALIAGCAVKSKAQLVEAAQRYRFMAAPAMDMADVAAFDHFQARGLFAPQAVGAQVVAAPARFAQFSNYQIEVRRPAPALGEHTAEVLQDRGGLSSVELEALFAQGVI